MLRCISALDTITGALDIAVEPDRGEVRLGPRLYVLAPTAAASFRAVCGDSGEVLEFELSCGGPAGYGVSTGTSGRARLLGIAWALGCFLAKQSPLPAAW